MRDGFLAWQCRIRQYAIRQAGGRPTAGMRPAVRIGVGSTAAGEITVLIVKRDRDDITAEFRHMVRRTHDPADRFSAALKYLAAAYYQRPGDFLDHMTALFAADSAFAARLLAAGECRLDFDQFSQTYRLPCRVRRLADDDPAYQATYWHNSLFNPALPPDVQVLAFAPDWSAATADPPPG